MIYPRVGNDDHSRLLETPRDIVGEVTRSESTSDRLGAGESSVLEDGTMSIWSGGDDTDVVRVIDSRQDTGCKDELLPSFADIDDVDT